MCQSLSDFASGFCLNGFQRHIGYELVLSFSSCPPKRGKYGKDDSLIADKFTI